MMTRDVWTIVTIAALHGACVVRPPFGDGGTSTGGHDEDGGAGSSGVPTTGGGAGESSPGPGESSSGGAAETAGAEPGSTGDEPDTCGFLCATTGYGPGPEPCDTLLQDCPDGEKCAPHAEGGSSWSSSKCVPVTGDGQPGDPCAADGGGLNGLDDCAKGVTCFDVDQNNQGICRELCSGSFDAPKCTDPASFSCTFVDEFFGLCLPMCDLLLQDCPGGELCLPISEGRTCMPDASGAAGQVFDPCELVNGCDQGLLCMMSTQAAECDPNVGGCCLPMCDLEDPAFVCPGAGQDCVSPWQEGMVPEAFTGIGVCMLPA
jgi:hypothetical protein